VPPAEDEAEVVGIPGEEHLRQPSISLRIEAEGDEDLRSCYTLLAWRVRRDPFRYGPFRCGPCARGPYLVIVLEV